MQNNAEIRNRDKPDAEKMQQLKKQLMVIPCRIDFGKNGVYDAMLIGKTVYFKNGSWWLVRDGVVDFSTTTFKYNGYWWYINKGRVDFSRPGNVVFFSLNVVKLTIDHPKATYYNEFTKKVRRGGHI